MRTTLVRVAVLALLIAGTATLSGALASPAGAATTGLDGTITDAHTGQPIANAAVYVQMPDGSNWNNTFTDATGHYEFPSLPDGQYTVEAASANYFTQWAFGKTDQYLADLVTVPGTASLALAPLEYGSIGGHLKTSTGGVRTDFGIEVTDANGNQVAWTSPDATGAWSATHLLIGQYKVAYHFPNNLTIWSHGHTDPFAADLFAVTADAQTTVDDPIPDFGSLSITVTDATTHKPLPGAYAYFQSGPSQFNSATADANGLITIADVVPGSYMFGVAGPGSNYDYLNGGADNVAVTANHTTSVAIALVPAAHMKVTVLDAATKTPVVGCLRYLTADATSTVPTPFSNCSGSNGQLSLDGFPAGKIKIFIESADDVHGAQWVGPHGGIGDQDDAKWFPLKGGQTTNVTVKLDRAGSVTGKITDAATHNPVAGVCPTVVPAYARDGFGFPYSSCSLQDGTYTMRGLGPYQWKIEFPDYSGTHAWQWSGNTPNRKVATPVQVNAGKTVTASAALRAPGVITGTVTKPSGHPEFVVVQAVDARTGDFACPEAAVSSTGTYTISGCNVADVRVTFYFSDATVYPRLVHTAPGRTVSGINITIP